MTRISVSPMMYFRRRRNKLLLLTGVVMCVWYFFSVNDYLQTKDFESGFDYPLSIDIKPLVRQVLQNKKPDIAPINRYPYRFLTNSKKCETSDKVDLFIVVKSAIVNYGHRMTIRLTYGQESIIQGRTMKVLFFLGVEENYPNTQTQKNIKDEIDIYNDIIQMDFHDNYFNNTIKTMMQFRWLYENCPNADYYFFTDDDMYVSTVNIFNYIEDEILPGKGAFYKMNNFVYTGYVFNSAPQRFKTSKWRVTLEEYPWNKWPTYVTAGAYLLSNKSLKVLYVGSLFVKHFRLDDIYLGIVAKKVDIEPQHCPNIYFYKKAYDKQSYRNVIASHGYSDHDELLSVWNEQMGEQL